MLRQVLVALSERPGLQRTLLAVPGSRRAVARFVAGDTLGEAVIAVRALNEQGIHASLNLLGEMTTTREDALAIAQTYATILQTIHSERLDCNLSVKLSQLGLDRFPDVCEASMQTLLVGAKATGNFVRIDMESSAYVDRTLALYRRLRTAGFSNVGIVLQSYLRRTESDLESLLPLAPRVRLVKGAYFEAASVAYPKKTDVDGNFRRLSERLLSSAPMPAIATHDERMIDHAKAYAHTHGISPTSFEFQMIYGVRRDLQERIVAEGYPMRVYVPFGTQWFPYFMRRLAERPANVMFILRAVFQEARRTPAR